MSENINNWADLEDRVLAQLVAHYARRERINLVSDGRTVVRLLFEIFNGSICSRFLPQDFLQEQRRSDFYNCQKIANLINDHSDLFTLEWPNCLIPALAIVKKKLRQEIEESGGREDD